VPLVYPLGKRRATAVTAITGRGGRLPAASYNDDDGGLHAGFISAPRARWDGGAEEHSMKRWTSFACALATVAVAAAVAAVADGQPASTAARTIEVVAGEFKFEPAVIDVVEGERIVLKARATDAKKHGLAIKEFGVKSTLPKTGETVSIEFTAGQPGTYTIACSVYCGSGHSRMKGRLVVSARK
jgi:cytochrome c oxidase subunit 2